MELADLAGADVVVLGVGVETLSVLPRIAEAGPGRLRVVEAATLDPERRARLAAVGVDPDRLSAAVPREAEVVLRSPGFPRHRPDVAALCRTARIATTPTGLWLAVRGPRRTVAVTGTKGKSTTATLIVTGLAHAGASGFVVGNIGTAAWHHDPHSEDIAVVELSSYHGADLICSGEVAVLTLLADDHLDWHGSAEAYRHDKLRVLDPTPGAATSTPEVRLALAGQELPAPLDAAVTRVTADGDHRDRNVALAVAAVRASLALQGAEPPDAAQLTEVLHTHEPSLASRFEVVASGSGICWVDDALASNPSATGAALERLGPGPAVLICGGHDRGVPLDPVTDTLDTWPPATLTVIWLGDGDDPRARRLAGHPAVSDLRAVTTLEAAVGLAAQVAGDDGTVVFSPLAPTPEAEGTWKDRSRRFRGAIAELA